MSKKAYTQIHCQGLISVILAVLFVTPLFAQPARPGTGPGKSGGDPETIDNKADPTNTGLDDFRGVSLNRRREKSRIRFFFGGGRNNFQPAILNETSSAWQLNNIISATSTYPAVLSLYSPEKLKAWSFNGGIDYTYKDRLFISANYYDTEQSYDRQDPAQVNFTPLVQSGGAFRRSYFEGMRINRYREINRNVKAMYLHPMLLRGFKGGVFLGKEWYVENNDISFGSYLATSSLSPTLPNTISWSEGGVSPAIYRMSGIIYGLAARYQIFEWFGMHYWITPLKRSGRMNMVGWRALNQTTTNTDGSTTDTLNLLVPVASAKMQDKGMRHRLEGVFNIYCRYTVHLGLLKEDFKRTYESYYGFDNGINAEYYSMKTPTRLGIGELIGEHPMSKFEVYIRFGAGFFF